MRERDAHGTQKSRDGMRKRSRRLMYCSSLRHWKSIVVGEARESVTTVTFLFGVPTSVRFV